MAQNPAPPVAPRRRNETPEPGTDCWYRLRSNGELVTARIIDHWEDDFGQPQRLRRPAAGCVHLEVDLDPERHVAAAERALRLDVGRGNEPGQYQLTKPADEDEKWHKLLERREIETEINRDRARSRSGL